MMATWPSPYCLLPQPSQPAVVNALTSPEDATTDIMLDGSGNLVINDIDGEDTFIRSDARAMLPVSPTATKYSSCRNV